MLTGRRVAAGRSAEGLAQRRVDDVDAVLGLRFVRDIQSKREGVCVCACVRA